MKKSLELKSVQKMKFFRESGVDDKNGSVTDRSEGEASQLVIQLSNRVDRIDS